MAAKKKKKQKKYQKKGGQVSRSNSYTLSKAEILQSKIDKVSRMKSLVTVYEAGEFSDVLSKTGSREAKAVLSKSPEEVEIYKSSKSNRLITSKALSKGSPQKEPYSPLRETSVPPQQNIQPNLDFLPNGTKPKMPVTRCTICDIFVREDRLKKHLQKVHNEAEQTTKLLPFEQNDQQILVLGNSTVPKKPTTTCSICGSPVRIDKLAKHKLKAHSRKVIIYSS